MVHRTTIGVTHWNVRTSGLRLKPSLISGDDRGGQPDCFRNTYAKGRTPHGIGACAKSGLT